MTGFILGILCTVAFIGANNAMKTLMTKVHQNNDEEMAKMKIPGYAIYSYIMFKRGTNNEDN